MIDEMFLLCSSNGVSNGVPRARKSRAKAD